MMNRKRIDFSGLTLLELLVVVVIMAVFSTTVLVLWDSFSISQDLTSATQKLYYDLGLAWKFARSLRNGYSYYGVRFYNDTGTDGAQYGYKILHFYGAGGIDTPPALPISNTTLNETIKSSQVSDNPEFLENTFFPCGVVINSTSEFKAGDTIVFTPQGSATTNGLTLLTDNKDTVTLSKRKGSKTLKIYNLTGMVEQVTP